MTHVFLDTNILVYHLMQNHEVYSLRSSRLIDDLLAGKTTASCTSTVILETTYVLEKGFRVPRDVSHPALTEFVRIPTIRFDFRTPLLEALDFWRAQAPLSFADCYHLVLTKAFGLDAICTFDRRMNRFPGVERIEP